MQFLSALAQHKLITLAAILSTAGVLLLLSWAGITPIGAPRATPTAAEVATVADELDAEMPIEPTAAAATDAQVVVYISGAVRAPDVYQLPKAARIKDIVLAAGGFAPEADPDQINLAEPLADGQHIHVPRQGEAGLPNGDNATGAAAAGPDKPIDINTASAAELDELPGIGQSLAQRIVEYRTGNGAFKSIEDLQNVKGIGAALFEKIAPLITVGA